MKFRLAINRSGISKFTTQECLHIEDHKHVKQSKIEI